MAAVLADVVNADEGVIDFSDHAPPPTPEQIARTKVYEERAKATSGMVVRLSAAVRASLLLRAASQRVGNPTPAQASGLGPQRDAFVTAADKLVASKLTNDASSDGPAGETPPPLKWESYRLSVDEVPAYVAAALTYAGALNALPPGPDLGFPVLDQAVNDTFWKLSIATDLLIGENAILNDRLEHWPHVGATSLISCADVNAASNDFRCASAEASGTVGDGNWGFGPVDLGKFCLTVDTSINDGRVWVRRDALDSAIIRQWLEGAVLGDVMTSSALDAEC